MTAAARIRISTRKPAHSELLRQAIEEAALRGQHVHYSVGPASRWCVTYQPVGFLWARTRSLPARQQMAAGHICKEGQ